MAEDKWEVVGKQADEWEVVGGNRSSENYAVRAAKAIPGAFEGVGRFAANVAGQIPQGIRMLGELPFAGSVGEAIARSESSNPINHVPRLFKETEQVEEMLGKGAEKTVDIAVKTAQAMGNFAGMGSLTKEEAEGVARTIKDPVERAKFLAATAKHEGAETSILEGIGNIVVPIPGLRGAGKVASKIAGTERRISNDLMREISEQEYKNPDVRDPTTEGGVPVVSPWEPSKGQQRLDLGDGPLGVKNPNDGYYEGGLPADAYLKGRFEDTGQGDLFAGTRPYENPAVMRAKELERSLQDGTQTVRNAPDTLEGSYPSGFDAESTLAMRSDLTMGDNGFDFQHRRSQADSIPYEKVENVIPERQPQLETTQVKAFDPPPSELTAFGKAGERHLARLEEALKKEAQDAITRDPSNLTMTRDMFPVGNGRGLGPIGKRNSGALNLGAIFGWDKPGKPRSVSSVIAKEGSEQALAKFSSIFDGHAIFKAAQATLNKSPFQKLMWISPDSFLRLAYPLGLDVLTKGDRRRDSSAFKLNRVRNALNKDVPLTDLPYLEIDNKGKVQGHEGRHRMMTFKRKGLDLVPLVLNFQDPRLDLPSHITPEGRNRNTPLVLSKHLTEVFPETDGADIPTKAQEQFPTADGSGLVYLGNGPFLDPRIQEKLFNYVTNFIKGSEKNTVEGIKSAAELYALDRRSPKEAVASIDPTTVEDIKGGLRFVLNAVDADGVARDTTNFKGTGQLIKLTRDRFKLIDRTTKAQKEDLLNKAEFVKTLRGYEKRAVSDESPIKLTQKALNKDWQSVYKDLFLPWWQASRDGTTPTLKPEMQKIYDSWQEVFEFVHTGMNDLRSAAGLPPIPKATAYFPGMRVGDWVVNWYDKNGQIIGSQAFETRGQANKFRHLRSQDPDVTVKPVEHRKRSLHDLRNAEFSVLEVANQLMKDQPDVQAEIQRALSQASQRRGFGGKHSLESKHLLGAMGTDYSRHGMVDMLRAFEMYTERSLDYMADLQKKKFTMELMEELGARQDLPDLSETKALVKDMYLNSIGAFSRDDGLTKVVNWAARQVGVGDTGVRNMIRNGSALVITWVLATSSFFLSQFVQSVSGYAGLTKSHGGGLIGAAKAPLSMATGILQTFNPDALSKEGLSYAAKNGYINADWAELYEARHTRTKDSALGELAAHPIAQIQRGFNYLTNTVEREVVRIPYFLMQLDALKGQIKDKTQLFEAAGEQTDNFMVDYRRQNEAMMLNKAGIAGDLVRPLKRFFTNLTGQYIQLLQSAKKGDVAPLASMLLASYLVGGALGNIASQTYDDFIRFLNTSLNKDIPTLRETVMKSDSSDLTQFGGMSALLGADVSSSVAQNSAKSMLSVPLVSVPFGMVSESFDFLRKKYKGTDTSADLMKVLLALSPPSTKELVRNQFVKDGIVPNPYADMEAAYTRTEKEQKEAEMRAFLLGRPSLNESRAREIVKSARDAIFQQLHERRGIADKLADTIIEGKSPTLEMIEQYMKEGGDPSKISDLVKRRIMIRNFNLIDREFMKKGVSGAAKHEALQDHKKAMEMQVEKQQFSPEDKHFEAYKQSRPQRPPVSDLHPPTFHEYLSSMVKKYPNPPVRMIEEDQPPMRGPITIDPSKDNLRLERIKAMQRIM